MMIQSPFEWLNIFIHVFQAGELTYLILKVYEILITAHLAEISNL